MSAKPYFVGLDRLRAYAFGLVFLSHMYFNFFPAHEVYRKIFAHGEVGVQIFFTLSAFLITYLSLREFGNTGSFSIRHFFKKRILRIWPVYALVVALSYLGYVFSGTTSQMGCIYMFAYFFGNVCMVQDFPRVAGALTISPMWSVSVEQQFYVLFPIIFLLGIYLYKRFSTRSANSIKKILLYCTVTLSIILIVVSLYIRYAHAENWRYVDYSLISALPAFIGGIFLGYLMYVQSRLIAHVRQYTKVYAYTGFLVFTGSLFLKNTHPFGSVLYIIPLICSVLVYIICTTEMEKSTLTTSVETEKRSLILYLGKISYGLYAYHMFAVFIVQHWIFQKFTIDPISASILTLVITIGIAHISYQYIESWFLKYK